MRSESVKNITDRNSLSELYSTLFIGRDVFLKADGINIKVNFIKFNNGKIYLDIPIENYDVKRTNMKAPVTNTVSPIWRAV